MTLKTSDEAVLLVRDTMHASIIQSDKKGIKTVHDDSQDQVWLLDSGATSHMTNSKFIFENFVKEERDICLADKEGKKLISQGRGEIPVMIQSSEKRVRLRNVLYVPEINTNLLSVTKITDHGYSEKFDKHGAIIYRNKEIKMTAVRQQNAYYCEVIDCEK